MPGSKGCAIVEFEGVAEAQQAIAMLNDTILDGRSIFCRQDKEDTDIKPGGERKGPKHMGSMYGKAAGKGKGAAAWSPYAMGGMNTMGGMGMMGGMGGCMGGMGGMQAKGKGGKVFVQK